MPHFRNINLDLYGLYKWGDLFNKRQLATLTAFIVATREAFHEIKKIWGESEYSKSLCVYLSLSIGRYLQRMSTLGVWHTGQETFEHPFGRQAIPMVWDYPESNPFSDFCPESIFLRLYYQMH